MRRCGTRRATCVSMGSYMRCFVAAVVAVACSNCTGLVDANLPPDAGTPVPDAASPVPDAGQPTPDAGPVADAGQPVPDGGTSDAGVDPCANVVCNQAPASFCVSSTVYQSFASPGSCSQGTCTYAPTLVTCASGLQCYQGACVTPPPVCDATTCTGCCNGTTCVDLSTQGATQCGKAGAMCGSCGSSTPVCQAGACINPCATVTCNQPPAAICLNATTVETYAATGTCDPLTGGCTYATSTSACTNGQQCAQGACVTPPPQCNANNCTGCCSGTTCVATANESAAACGSGGAACVSCGSATPVCQSGACVDLCVGVTCNQLPAPFCFDTHTVESYVTPGTCAPATGTCTYVPSQVPCGAGQVCQSGACVAQAADSGYNFIFVAPPTVAPEFFGGLAGADALCQAAAQDAGLPGTYLAWLSTSTVNAKDRFTAARGWVRPDGLPFADSMASLTALQNFYPPALDAHGKNVGAIILPTGTLANGLKTSLTCLNWTGYQEMSGPGGYPQAGAGQWTDARTTEALCARPGALYCLGIDHNTPLTFAPAAGRRMFLSTPWIPSGGLAGADAHCASDAAAANVTGTFQALLATSTASAGSRFAPGNWVRLDGVSVGDMTTGPLTAPPLLSSTGAYTASSYAWTGAALPTAVALGAAYTCQDWTAAAGSLVDVGTPDTSAAGFFFGSQATCASTLVSLYCLEP